ncbi:glycosyltransferase family 2 protein [uncultured Flavobacterium sp.]|uniref:glycosyltransferase family 2 protein n=1 Tax=uncultured Flavobacterium sp. TaxID=165435 RepID=UPI0029315943|nr:glycosyltransferase family 2 protein [uncultured Flavobacterium sp.]
MISIITINYNNLAGLKRTVESVINQTWQEFEYIIIDGGSTDGSAGYIESKLEHIDYWVSEPDNGIYNAMNKGIKKAAGEYLLFLNSGDILDNEDALGHAVSQFDNSDLIVFDQKVVGDSVFYLTSPPSDINFSYMYFGYLPHASTFIKKKLFNRAGLYDENLRIVSDWKFMMVALFRYYCTYSKKAGVLSIFELGGFSSIYDDRFERNQVISKYFGVYKQDMDNLQQRELLLKQNRYKMLQEIETRKFGKKIVSVFFRVYLFLIPKKNTESIS